MLYKTRGIALSYLKYKETSILAKIYTEAFGIQTYIVNGVRSSRSKNNKIALFQPLTLLDLVVYHKPKNDSIHRISEVRNLYPFSHIPFEPAKSVIAIFLTEILTKVLQEEEENTLMFDFLENSINYLEHAERIENFHLQFLLQMTPYLGFGVSDMNNFYYQLRESQYGQLPTGVELKWLTNLLQSPYGLTLPITRADRYQLLTHLIFFYRLHIENLGDIKSLEILKEIMN